MASKDDDKVQPLIIKRINKVAGGHHGGAWKVAYADFVTAMMAFFLLLWLLATTTPEQRTGIAEYFTPTVGLKDSKGIGFEGGLTPNEKGSSRTTLTSPGLVTGQIQGGPTPQAPTKSQDVVSPDESAGGGMPLPDAERVKVQESVMEQPEETKPAKADKEHEAEEKKIEEQITSAFEQTPELEQMKKNIIITNTPEGLKVDVVEDPAKPMFVPDTSTMTDIGRKMFKAISGVILRTQRRISITGNTETIQYPAGAVYTNWELSSDRANATRRFLAENLVEPERMSKVVGMADKELLLPKEPLSARNRRISIVMLRGEVVAPKDASVGRDLLTTPEVDPKTIAPKPPEPPKPPEKPVELPQADPNFIFAPVAPEDKQGFIAPEGANPAR